MDRKIEYEHQESGDNVLDDINFGFNQGGNANNSDVQKQEKKKINLPIESEYSILVAVRVRPLNSKEYAVGDFEITRVDDNLIIILDPVDIEFEVEKKKMIEVLHRSKEQRYAFDKIFTHHSQEEIYEETCKHLIRPVLAGFNATVFAYGPTGTGKTYTMLGNSEVPGLSVLTVKDIIENIKKDDEREYNVTITYVEIYNESIRDLLVPNSSYLELRDDPIKGITIAGVTEIKVETSEHIMNLLFAGNRRRTTEATNANLTSSRSHAVFQISVASQPRTRNTNVETLVSKLSLIDLAGSERGTVTENRGIRLREGAKINRSLLALANCINALGDKTKKGFFVPFRDSKLTRMLKDSLGGNCKTVMIANISPAGSQFEETINTLKYANRAKNIKTKVQSNKKMVSLHIAEYKNIINDLRLEIEQLKGKLHDNNLGRGPSPLTHNINDLFNDVEEKRISIPSNVKGECPNCSLRRNEDEEEMKKIQAEIFENFQERIQLRRALMELEEQNAMNVLEIKKKQAEIALWNRENAAPPKSQEDSVAKKREVPAEIKQLVKNIHTLKASTDKNAIKREIMNLQLMENITVAKRIRDAIPKRIKLPEKRDYLELVIKNHVLELQNIELEIHLQIQEKSIQDLKNIVDSQKRMMAEMGPAGQIIETKGGLLENGANSPNSDAFQAGGAGPENELDLEEIIYAEEFNDENQDEDEDDEEEINELTNFKELIEKTQQNIIEMSNQQAAANRKEKKEKSIPENRWGHIRTESSETHLKNRDKSAPKSFSKNNYEENKEIPKERELSEGKEGSMMIDAEDVSRRNRNIRVIERKNAQNAPGPNNNTPALVPTNLMQGPSSTKPVASNKLVNISKEPNQVAREDAKTSSRPKERNVIFPVISSAGVVSQNSNQNQAIANSKTKKVERKI